MCYAIEVVAYEVVRVVAYRGGWSKRQAKQRTRCYIEPRYIAQHTVHTEIQRYRMAKLNTLQGRKEIYLYYEISAKITTNVL